MACDAGKFIVLKYNSKANISFDGNTERKIIRNENINSKVILLFVKL